MLDIPDSVRDTARQKLSELTPELNEESRKYAELLLACALMQSERMVRACLEEIPAGHDFAVLLAWQLLLGCGKGTTQEVCQQITVALQLFQRAGVDLSEACAGTYNLLDSIDEE